MVALEEVGFGGGGPGGVGEEEAVEGVPVEGVTNEGLAGDPGMDGGGVANVEGGEGVEEGVEGFGDEEVEGVGVGGGSFVEGFAGDGGEALLFEAKGLSGHEGEEEGGHDHEEDVPKDVAESHGGWGRSAPRTAGGREGRRFGVGMDYFCCMMV